MLFRYPFRAMGTGCEILIRGKHMEAAKSAVKVALQEVKRLEKKYSFYDSASMLSELNREAKQCRVTLDKETKSLLQFAEQLYYDSEKLFDATIGGIKECWDFKQMEIPNPQHLNQKLLGVGWHGVEFHKEENWIYFQNPRIEIDLGGIVKEYAVDQCATLLEAMGVDNGLVNLGGDLRVLGKAGVLGMKAWKVGVTDPRNHNQTLGSFNLEKGAIVTSGDNQRYFIRDGVRYHHLINPKTGMPHQLEFSAVTVHASSAMEASQLTSRILLGGKKQLELLHDQLIATCICDSQGNPILWKDSDSCHLQKR